MIGLFFASFSASAQVVYEPVANPVYDLVHELVNQGIAELNTAVKPYPRKEIARVLNEAQRADSLLTDRQLKEIEFYLRDFGRELGIDKDNRLKPDLFHYSSPQFMVTVNPLIGGNFVAGGDNSVQLERLIGGSFWGYAGGKVGFWARVSDYSQPEYLANEPFSGLPGRGGNFKYSGTGEDALAEANEINAGLSFAWKWGHVALVHDQHQWGNSYRSPNIISGRAPSYFFFDLRIKPTEFIEFTYIHSWLNSERLDSARTYLTPYGNRRVYTNKNMAANFVTIRPWKRMHFSLGNSIVYSDDGVKPVYFIPIIFFKSADHAAAGAGSSEVGQNNQLFADVSVRLGHHFHLYGTWFADELSFRNVLDSEKQTNIWSYKAGVQAANILPNLSLTAEYTANRPWVYRHQIESTSYASNGYGLGHYLEENSQELYGSIDYRPLRALRIHLFGALVQRGARHEYAIINGNANVTGLDFLSGNVQEIIEIGAEVRYEIIPNAIFRLGITDRSYSGTTSPLVEPYDQLWNASFTFGFR